jgi:hypothetical protein
MDAAQLIDVEVFFLSDEPLIFSSTSQAGNKCHRIFLPIVFLSSEIANQCITGDHLIGVSLLFLLVLVC